MVIAIARPEVSFLSCIILHTGCCCQQNYFSELCQSELFRIAQLVEQLYIKQEVSSSTPGPDIFHSAGIGKIVPTYSYYT